MTSDDLFILFALLSVLGGAVSAFKAAVMVSGASWK